MSPPTRQKAIVLQVGNLAYLHKTSLVDLSNGGSARDSMSGQAPEHGSPSLKFLAARTY